MTIDENLFFQKKFKELMINMIDNTKEFDDNLRLKMQMNIDMIWQDQRLWTQ